MDIFTARGKVWILPPFLWLYFAPLTEREAALSDITVVGLQVHVGTRGTRTWLLQNFDVSNLKIPYDQHSFN